MDDNKTYKILVLKTEAQVVTQAHEVIIDGPLHDVVTLPIRVATPHTSTSEVSVDPAQFVQDTVVLYGRSNPDSVASG